MLGRKVNEEILIGPDIVVRVTRIDRNCVHLAVRAPRAINIVRAELGAPRVTTPSPSPTAHV